MTRILLALVIAAAPVVAMADGKPKAELPPDWMLKASIPILDRCLVDVEFLKKFNAQQDRILGNRHREVAYRTAVMQSKMLQGSRLVRDRMRENMGLPLEKRAEYNDRGEKTFDPIAELRTKK